MSPPSIFYETLVSLALSNQASAKMSLDATTKSRPGPLRAAGSDAGAASSGTNPR